MKVSLGLSLLLAILDPGNTFQCEVCHSLGKTCSGPRKNCSGDENTCGTIVHEATIGGMEIYSSIKTCLMSSVCHLGAVTMNYGKVKGRTGLACCVGDACQKVSASLPPVDNVPNGLQCPACYSMDSFQCGNETVNCAGSETQCIDLAGLINSGGLFMKVAMKGCTTLSECNDAGEGKKQLGMMDMKIRQFKCKPASLLARVHSGPSPPKTLFLPVLSGLILEKVLF
ncbi:phospholipase A2 inhibitor and Ly6/PLAUR domain-containing protein-like [Apteryx mantelli]|uniref:Phospholipase A2 inhibitor and Ly6/PLAUR domain-containing protein-like n=1 Tax=Apteryx mantelli TaxID=2696672 RepID=A0A8B7IIU4_9AVES